MLKKNHCLIIRQNNPLDSLEAGLLILLIQSVLRLLRSFFKHGIYSCGVTRIFEVTSGSDSAVSTMNMAYALRYPNGEAAMVNDRKVEGIHLVYMYVLSGTVLKISHTFSLSISENVRIRYVQRALHASKEERYIVVLLSGSDGNI